jgi:archaellum component FlaC
MDRTINDIITTGREMNQKMTEKIENLNKSNDAFYNALSKRLTDILNSIANFKDTNLKGLTDTKNQLATVTTELEKTRTQLDQTKLALEKVTTDLNASQTELTNANSIKNELEVQVRDLNKTIEMMDTEYINKIETIKQDMTKNAAQEKSALQEEYTNKINALEDERNNLLKQIEQAKESEKVAMENLTKIQGDQDSLIQQLATINEILVQQLVSIDDINADQPNIDSYSDLLTSIEQGLNSVKGEINQAVSNVIQPVANTSQTQTPLYDKFKSLNPDDKEKIYDKLDETDIVYANDIQQELQKQNPSKSQIHNILTKHYINKLNGAENLLRGGRRKRRTMKKRPKKTRKLRKSQKGGYTYSASKELDKASSVISNSSTSTSNSGFKTRTIRSKKKSRRRSRK